MKEFKGVWIPYEIFINKKLTDKEKFVYSMIIFLSKENEYINTKIIYKENSKEIALRKILPIIKNDNTYKQINVNPINRNTKDI